MWFSDWVGSFGRKDLRVRVLDLRFEVWDERVLERFWKGRKGKVERNVGREVDVGRWRLVETGVGAGVDGRVLE